MSAPSLRGLWDDAANSPFQSTIPKESQFTVAAALLLIAAIFTSLFGLGVSFSPTKICSVLIALTYCKFSDLKLKNIPLYALPAALAFG
jgi:hypothetical protein